MATLPPSTDYTGSAVTQGGKKTFISTMRTFLSDLLGTDSSNKAAARTALGAAASGANTDITSLSGVTSINGKTLLPVDNLIVNGCMRIDQRRVGAALTVVAGSSPLQMSLDHWQVRSAGANATVQQVTVSGQKRMRFTGAASVTAVAAHQRIRAENCAHLAGKTVTLSFKASSSSLTSLTVDIYRANSTDTFGPWSSPSVTSEGTGTVTINTTEQTVSLTVALSSSATTGLEIRITGGALGAAATLTLGDVILEQAASASAFPMKPKGHEMALCLRRYRKSFPQATAPAQNVGNNLGAIGFVAPNATGPVDVTVMYGAPMEASPTLTTYAPDAATSNWSTNVTTPTASLQYTSESSFGIRASTGLTANAGYSIHWTAEVEPS